MQERSNAEWIAALTSTGPQQDEALRELNALEERAARFYLARAGSSLAPDQQEALAQDAAQEATLLVLDKVSSFRGEAKFRTWASTFAVRIVMTNLRRRKWRDVSLGGLPNLLDSAVSRSAVAAGAGTPEAAVLRQAMWDVVVDVVQRDLTEKQRSVLNLVVMHGVPTEEVEARLGVSASALYKLTHDARRKLKAGLEKRGFTTAEIMRAFASDG